MNPLSPPHLEGCFLVRNKDGGKRPRQLFGAGRPICKRLVTLVIQWKCLIEIGFKGDL